MKHIKKFNENWHPEMDVHGDEFAKKYLAVEYLDKLFDEGDIDDDVYYDLFENDEFRNLKSKTEIFNYLAKNCGLSKSVYDRYMKYDYKK